MILKIFGLAVLLSITAFMLRSFGWRGAPVFASVALVILLTEAAGVLESVLFSVRSIGVSAGLSEPVTAALKVLGLGYLYGICADVCRDMSEVGIGKAVDAVGRVEIVAVVMPYFEDIIKVGVELIG